MSFQNKLFRNNLKVAIIPIISFAMIILIFLGLYRHTFYSDLSGARTVSDDAKKIIQVYNQTKVDDFNRSDFNFTNYANIFSSIGYSIAVIKDDEFIFSNLRSQDKEAIADYTLSNLKELINIPFVTTHDNKNLVMIHKQEQFTDYHIVALSNRNHFRNFAANNYFFCALLLLLLIFIILVFIICKKYSKRLTRQLMLPIEQLGEGAKRIQEGNLDIQLEYNNEDEFKQVFDSFNEMQLRLKQSILTSINREKTQQEMIAEISHDLKTPLTAIKGYVKGIEDGIANTPEKQAHYFRKIRSKTDNMIYLIDEILMFSRLDRNKIMFHVMPTSIDTYLKEVTYAFQEEYYSSNLTIEFIPDATNAIVNLDTVQFNRVLENILENSRKYSGREHTLVVIRTALINDSVIITLQDNGNGIEEDKLSHIFETFYRGDDTRNQAINGSGLGLAISRQIIEQLNGTITAKNADGLCINITLNCIKQGD